MSVVTRSTPVNAGDDALAEQYNNLRDDLIAVESNSPPVGSIVLWAGTEVGVPDGWMICDGRELSRTEYSLLYSRLGTMYGAGDGSTTFNIPDLRDRFVVGVGNDNDEGDTGGAKVVNTAHTHSIPPHRHHIPSHSHTGPAHTHSIPSHRHGHGDLAAHVGVEYNRVYVDRVGGGFTADYANYTDATHRNNHIVANRAKITGNTAYGGGGETGSSGTGLTGEWSGDTDLSITFSTGSSGVSNLENRPPYMALHYIIKVK